MQPSRPLALKGILRKAKNAALTYISIGGDVGVKTPKTSLDTQQFPRDVRGFAAANPEKKVVIVLVSMVWAKMPSGLPRLLTTLVGTFRDRHKQAFQPFNFGNVTIYWLEGSFKDDTDASAVGKFAENMQPGQRLLVGDFTLVEPWEPFDNFPNLYNLVAGHPAVFYMDDWKDGRMQELVL